MEVSIRQWSNRAGQWLDGVQNPTVPPLRDFKNLSSLSVSCSDNFPRAYSLRDEVAAAINASPSLANLRISTWSWDCGGGFTPLQAFLETSRPELVRLELGNVPLPGEGIREILSDKLQHLSVSTPLGDHCVDFNWRKLWGALQEAWIALSILKVSGMENAMDEMSSYLLSYSGLERLEITHLQLDGQEEEDRASLVFWHEIIPHHRDSLTAPGILSILNIEQFT